MRNIGIIVTHNILSSLRTTIPDAHLILSKSLSNPKLLQTPNANYHFQLLTIQNPSNSSIETRSKRIEEKISNFASQNNLDGIHIISNSVSGLDARYLLGSNTQMNRLCHTLVTVNSPNQGSHLANMYMSGTVDQGLMDRLSVVLGVSPESFSECNSANVQSLNDYLDDFFDERIFTIGASKEFSALSDLFKESTEILLTDLTHSELDTDGILFSKESLLNIERNIGIMEGDHFDLSCLSDDTSNKGTYGVAIDFCMRRLF